MNPCSRGKYIVNALAILTAERTRHPVVFQLHIPDADDCRKFRPRWTHRVTVDVQNVEVGHEQSLAGHSAEDTSLGARGADREACALLLVAPGRRASPPAAVQRHVAQALGAAPTGRIEGNRLTDIWRRNGDARASVGKMFPENGSGVEAARDCDAWELDERATKQSGHAERGWVYQGPDSGDQDGNSGKGALRCRHPSAASLMIVFESSLTRLLP